MDELTDNEKQLLAREVARDKWLTTENYGGDWGDIFDAGWDAAMEYVNARKQVQQSE